MIAFGTAVNVVTGKETARIASRMEFHNNSNRLSLFWLKNVDVETAARPANKSMAMVRMTTEMNRTTMQPFFQILIRQGNLSTALLDSGSNVSLVKRKFLQSLGFKCALEVGNGKILTANSTTMPVKSKAELTVQLEKIAHKIRVSFLISTLETFNSLQGLKFPTESDCIYFAKVQKLFFGKYAKRYNCTPVQQTMIQCF